MSHRSKVFLISRNCVICRYVYGLAPYHISHAYVQWFISLCNHTESQRELSHGTMFYILQNNYLKKSPPPPQLSYVIPPYKFMHLPHCYYQLQKIKKFEYGLASTCIVSIPNFIRIHPAVLKLKREQTHMISSVCIHFMHIIQRTHNN
jgi:hypothetical protein